MDAQIKQTKLSSGLMHGRGLPVPARPRYAFGDLLTLRVLRPLRIVLANSALFMIASTEGQLMKWRFKRIMRRGEKIEVDKLGFSIPPHLQIDPSGKPRADLMPNDRFPRKKSPFMTQERFPEPRQGVLFGYRDPPVAGNYINGHEEPAVRRPTKVFHSANYRIPFGGLERFFHTMSTVRVLVEVLRARWQDRDRIGPVAIEQVPVDDPDEMAQRVKREAMRAGAAKVGITRLVDSAIFEHVDMPYEHAICVAVPMPLDDMRTCPSQTSDLAVQKGYYDAATAANAVAEKIRAMGWDAIACTNLGSDTSEIQHIPLAINAGLGQLGKHNSLICAEYGSNVRLATVLTNMPLAHDAPVDIGVDDFCSRCQVCVTNCPPQAIYDTKQLVRGVERWFMDFDKCGPYFSEYFSCGLCIVVCPWTAPGQGETIMRKMLAAREKGEAKAVVDEQLAPG